jgi:hypothetical protein
MEKIYTIEKRKERISIASKMLDELIPCELRKAITTIALALGIREEKAREYIKLIANANNLVIENGMIKKQA